MKKFSLRSQMHDNAIALISLVVAIIALVLNTWRLEQTEKNRNIRQAGFEILKNLGQLQSVINLHLYQPSSTMQDPLEGWSYIAMMSDIVVLMPPPIPEDLQELIKIWSLHWKDLSKEESSAEQVSHQIDRVREAVMKALNQLH